MKITIALDSLDFSWCEHGRVALALEEEYEKALKSACWRNGFKFNLLKKSQGPPENAVVLDFETWEQRWIEYPSPFKGKYLSSGDTARESALECITEIDKLDMHYAHPDREEEMIEEMAGDAQIRVYELNKED